MAVATQDMKQRIADPSTPWDAYRDNVWRHLLGIARHYQAQLMYALESDCGHRQLRLSFAPYITLIGEQARRSSDLAELLGISRQACNQVVVQLVNAGYVLRTPDPMDGRAKLLALSAQGEQLRRDGIANTAVLDAELAQLLGQRDFIRTSEVLAQLVSKVSRPSSEPPQRSTEPPQRSNNTRDSRYVGIVGYVPRLADFTLQRLLQFTKAKGHPALKLSFSQVLNMIGPEGGRMPQMASAHDVSKQAINAIVSELESLNYVQRMADPRDARQVVLQFTAHGEQLISDSVASIAELADECTTRIGAGKFQFLCEALRTIYQALALEQDVFHHNHRPINLTLLAQQLRQQLGAEQSIALAKLLANSHNSIGKKI